MLNCKILVPVAEPETAVRSIVTSLSAAMFRTVRRDTVAPSATV